MQDARTVSDTELCEEMVKLLKRFKTILAETAEAHGLTTMQLSAMRAISEGCNSMGRVAQMMHCDNSNVTGIIDRLVSMKLVSRQEDSRDRRVKMLTLTPKGNSLVSELAAQLPNKLGCTKLSDDEKLSLHLALGKLAD